MTTWERSRHGKPWAGDFNLDGSMSDFDDLANVFAELR